MWARGAVTCSPVTVHAQEAVFVFRPSLAAYIPIDGPADSTSVALTATSYMVQGQEGSLQLTTTGTLPAISVEHLLPKLHRRPLNLIVYLGAIDGIGCPFSTRPLTCVLPRVLDIPATPGAQVLCVVSVRRHYSRSLELFRPLRSIAMAAPTRTRVSSSLSSSNTLSRSAITDEILSRFGCGSRPDIIEASRNPGSDCAVSVTPAINGRLSENLFSATVISRARCPAA